MEQDKELERLILENLEESRFIANNYNKVTDELKKQFRNKVKNSLREKLGADFEVRTHRKIDENYSKLWIQPRKWLDTQLKFAIEPFSGKGNKDGYLFIGLYDKKDSQVVSDLPPRNRINKTWKQTEPLLTKDGNKIKFKDVYTLQVLANSEGESYRLLLDNIVNQTLKFVKEYENILPAEVFQEN